MSNNADITNVLPFVDVHGNSLCGFENPKTSTNMEISRRGGSKTPGSRPKKKAGCFAAGQTQGRLGMKRNLVGQMRVHELHHQRGVLRRACIGTELAVVHRMSNRRNDRVVDVAAADAKIVVHIVIRDCLLYTSD